MKKLISILIAASMSFSVIAAAASNDDDGALTEGQMELESEQFEDEMQSDRPSGEEDKTGTEEDSGTGNQNSSEKEKFTEKELNCIRLLSRLNIAEWEGLSYNDMLAPVSRADAVTVLLRLLGFSENVSEESGVMNTTLTYPDLFAEVMEKSKNVTTDAIFTDVPQGHRAYEAVRAAYILGLIKGSGGGLFNPDSAVTYEQLAKMAVYVIGYENEAYVKGGYPNGYVRVMHDKKIFPKNISKLTQPVAKLSFAGIIKEITDTPVLSIKSISGDTVKYSAADGETVLSNYMSIEKKKGTVDGNRFSCYGGGKTSGATVSIDSEVFKDSGFEGDGLLGQLVTCYYKDDRALALFPERKSQIIVSADDVNKCGNIQHGGAYISYEKDGKAHTEYIADNAVYIKNNTLLSAASEADFDFDDGYITLTDNDGDSRFDVVSAAEYDIYITDSVLPESEKIGDKSKTKATLDLSDRDYVLRRQGGGKLELSEIEEFDCLNVITPINAEGRYEIIVTSSKSEGTITAHDDEKIYIDGAPYKTSNGILPTDAENGKKCTFVTDASGKIAYLSINNNGSGTYGWVLRAMLDPKQKLKKRIALKLAKEDKKDEVLYTDTEVKIDGKRIAAEKAINQLGDRMLIKYTLSEDGAVDEIFLPKLNDNKSVDTEHFSLDCKLTKAYNNYNYRYGEMYNMTTSTLVILTVNDDYEKPELLTDASNCLITNRSSLSYNTAKYSNVEIYDADENYSIGVAVIKDNASFASGTSGGTMSNYKSVLVTSVKYARDKETDDMRKQIEYVNFGGTVNRAFISDNFSLETKWCASKTFDDVRPGDIIAVDVNASNEIYRAAFLLDSDSIHNGSPNYVTRASDESGGETKVHGEMFFSFARVIEKSGNTIITEAPDASQPSGTKRIGTTMNANVLIFDVKDQTWRKGTPKDVFKDDDVYIHVSWQWFQGVVVYR